MDTILQIGVGVIALLILVLGPIFIRFVLVWYHRTLENLKAEAPELIVEIINEAALIGAAFAERHGEAIRITGREKMGLAIEAAERYLESIGYDIELDILEMVIEKVLVENFDYFPRRKQNEFLP